MPQTQKAGRSARATEALRWIHHDSPLVLAFYNNPLVLSEQDGNALRHAALVFHSRVQQQRYSTGNTFRTQQQQVEYLVDAEHAHLLAPFTAPGTLQLQRRANAHPMPSRAFQGE